MAGVALFGVAVAGQDGNALRFTLKEGTDTYASESKDEQSIEIPNVGTQSTTVTKHSTYELKYAGVDTAKDTANLTLTRTVDKVEATGDGAEQETSLKRKPFVLTGTVNSLGSTKFDLTKLNMTQALEVSGGSPAEGLIMQMPEKAVKVGDTWDVKIAKGATSYPEDQALKATLTGEKDLDGAKVWVITVVGKAKVDMNTAQFPDDPDATGAGANLKLHLTGAADVNSTVFVDKASGKVLRSEEKVKLHGQAELASPVITVELNSTQTGTITLKK